MGRVKINNLTRRMFTRSGFTSLFNQIIAAEKLITHLEVIINIVGPKKIRELNRQYRKKNTFTDVLSFNEPSIFWPLGNKKNSIGELFICPQVIQENAKQYGVNYSEELKRVLIHGILHLLKYTHKKNLNDGQEEMFIRQEKYLKIANRLSLIK